MSEKSNAQEFALSQTDRLALVGLTDHPGFKVLTQMMDAAVRRANEKVIQCDPTEEKMVIALQKEARAANEFCAMLRKVVNWHVACQRATKQAPLTAADKLAGVKVPTTDPIDEAA